MDPKYLSQRLGFPIAAADATTVKKPKPQLSADLTEKLIRAEPQPEDEYTRFSRKPDERTPSNQSLFRQGPVRPAIPNQGGGK